MSVLATSSHNLALRYHDPASDRRAAITILALAAVFAFIPAVVLQSPSLLLLAAAGLAALILVEPWVGLLSILAVLGIDAASFDPVTGGLEPVLLPLQGILATPAELLVLWTTLAAGIRTVSERRSLVSDPMLMSAAAIFGLLVLGGVVLGAVNGSDLTIALWEVRSLLLIPLVMLATSMILKPEHLKYLALALAGVLAFMSLEAFWRYVTYVRPGTLDVSEDFAFGHETAVLTGLLMVMGIAWWLWGPNRGQRYGAALLALFAAIVLLTMQRRAGVIAGEAGILTIALFLLLTHWRRFLVVAPIGVVFAAIYLSVFWNDPNSFGQPARAFRTIFLSAEVDARDQASDEYRRIETFNIWRNIESAPVEGLGFGTVYAKPEPLPDLSSFWPFWEYIAHNTMLWLWMKGGLLTFGAFWFLLGAAIARLVAISRATDSGLAIAASATCGAFICMSVLYAYVDLGLVNTRMMLALGLCLGLVGVVQRLASEHPPQIPKEGSTRDPSISNHMHARPPRPHW